MKIYPEFSESFNDFFIPKQRRSRPVILAFVGGGGGGFAVTIDTIQSPLSWLGSGQLQGGLEDGKFIKLY